MLLYRGFLACEPQTSFSRLFIHGSAACMANRPCFNLVSVGTNPHLPTAVRRVAFYWWPPHRSPTVAPHSLFFGLLIFD
jgi:hypothetical protein